MKAISFWYIANATLLLLHEIESAYEREWELLKLPGRITGFLLLHVPMIVIFFYGLIEIQKESAIGWILGIILGIGGVIPAIVHKILFRAPDRFSLPISHAIIYSNVLSGIVLSSLSVHLLAG